MDLVKTASIKRIVNRRERNGNFEYKVVWNTNRRPKWLLRSRFESLDLVEAFDAETLRAQQYMDHEANKTRNMKIIGERSDGDGTKYLVVWSGETWEDRADIPKEVMALWVEEKLLKTPSPNK